MASTYIYRTMLLIIHISDCISGVCNCFYIMIHMFLACKICAPVIVFQLSSFFFIPAKCVKCRNVKVCWHLLIFSFMRDEFSAVQCVTQPPSIGSLLSPSTFTNQRQTSSPQSQNRGQVVPRQRRRTSKQAAGVCCFLGPPAEATALVIVQ